MVETLGKSVSSLFTDLKTRQEFQLGIYRLLAMPALSGGTSITGIISMLPTNECIDQSLFILRNTEDLNTVERVPHDLLSMNFSRPEGDGVTTAMKSDPEKHFSSGISDYDANPIDLSELLAVISRWGIEAITKYCSQFVLVEPSLD